MLNNDKKIIIEKKIKNFAIWLLVWNKISPPSVEYIDNELINPNNKIQNNKISLPDQKIKVFLRQIMTGRPVLNPSAFFLALERGLDIQSSNYRSVRRLAQDWDRLNGMQKSLVVTRMLQFFRSKALRSELYTYIRDMSRTQGLEIKGAGNAEEPKARGVDTLKSVAANVAVAAGGFAAGRAFGRRIAK